MDMLSSPQNLISVFTFALRCDQYMLRKNVWDFFTCWNFDLLLLFAEEGFII